ncbi:unnamed protein product [Auanema sp. JU1783]|nr:unnamed protein product [Auanema sp. JU1783]
MPPEKNSKQDSNVLCILISLLLMLLVNVLIVFLIRVALDATDEINEPLITGEDRAKLFLFLLVFIMTFFFGCWCCCCCACLPCRLLPECPSAFGNMITAISHKFISSHPSIRKRFSIDEDEIEIAEVVVAAENLGRPPLSAKNTDQFAYENPIPMMDDIVESEAANRVIAPPERLPLGRLRSYSIDVSYK